ncbi:hypothetical protein AB1L88_25130 [Tautonia sp. JC769]|uniref:hypothetical protein n=1 Tax=Tautonia sp. JC769 TaxID=3232135 RepID=UPI003458ECD6
MAMTVSEMLDFFRGQIQRSQRGMDAAKSTGIYPLAELNCRQSFKCRLMISLIEWRNGIDPSNSLSEVAAGFADDWAKVVAVGGDKAKTTNVPAERLAFVVYLIGKPCFIDVSSDGLEGDRLLDLVLGDWLFDSWNGKLWENGMAQLRRAGSDLAVRTYELYKTIIDAAGSDVTALSHEGERLFAKRKSDAFFCGGDQTEGGGNDNNVTIDYRLAALLKRSGFHDASGVHVWKW